MELLDIYSDRGEKTGRSLPREHIFDLLADDERILLVHTCLINQNGKMLIQQRQFNKDRYPGCWDVSAGGFVIAGESPEEAARRELKEELGAETDRVIYEVCCEPFGKVLDYFYIVFCDAPADSFSLQKDEVASVKWESGDEILKMIQNGSFVDYSKTLIEKVFEKAEGLSEVILPGKYRHFKGNEYEVLFTARNSETEELMVVYRALYGEKEIWVRPASMWNATVVRNGKEYRRFTKISDREDSLCSEK